MEVLGRDTSWDALVQHSEWPTGRTVAILDIEIRPVKDRSQESSCPDAVRTAGWWFQQAAQRLRAVSNRGPQAARRGFGDGPGLAEAVV